MKIAVLHVNIILLLFQFYSSVEAQQLRQLPRIGYLLSLDPIRESARSEAMRRTLRELGYIEGKNIASEYRYTEGKLDRAPELAAELVL